LFFRFFHAEPPQTGKVRKINFFLFFNEKQEGDGIMDECVDWKELRGEK
jgi:hypothetical protein